MALTYVTVDTLKGTGALNIAGTSYDARLRVLGEAISRQIDRFCNRSFPPLTETRTFDGDNAKELLLPDVISVTTLKEDTNEDGTFETTWAAADYIKYPLNAQPTADWGGPFTSLRVSPKTGGTQDEFLAGIQMYEIAGTWGYRYVTREIGLTGTMANGTTGTLTLSGRADGTLEVGHLLAIGTEWLYVTAWDGTAATVRRAQNGSTGTAQTGATIKIVEYPNEIVEAALIQVARLWKRKDSAFAGDVGMTEAGQMVTELRGLDRDVRELLSPFRRFAI